MSIVFSVAELRALAHCSQLLLDPFGAVTIDEWRSRVLSSLKPLLGADAAGFHLPETGGHLFYTDDYSQELLDSLPDVEPPPLPDGTPVVSRALELGVGRLETLYAPDAQRYYRSAFYNEYASQLRKHDLLYAMTPLPGGEDAVASLQFFHQGARGCRFGEREVEILRLLLPALRAGSESVVRWGRAHGDLMEALDRAGTAAVLLDLDGRTLHRSRALDEILRTDPQRERILSGISEAAACVHELPTPAERSIPPGSCERVVTTCIGRYRVRVCLRGDAYGGGARTLVSVERLTRAPRSEADLREHYSLTAAELRVAALLAAGLSNADVARELCISPFTARRHTERVLLKMNLRSRAEVAARFFS